MRRNIPTAQVGKQVLDKAIVRAIHRLEKIAQLTPQFASGTMAAVFDTGNYTYFGHQLGIRSTVEIVGETVQVGGVHWVKPEFMKNYIDEIRIELDTRIISTISIEHLYYLNRYKNTLSDHCLHITHGGPEEFTTGARHHDFADYYGLGTGGVLQYKIWFDIGAAWDGATMALDIVSEYARSTKRPGALLTYDLMEAVAPGSGVFTFSDLPTYTDISRIFVMAAGMTDGQLIVDNETAVGGSIASINDNLKKFGRDPSVFPNSFIVDFLREGDPRQILKSLEGREQIKRNAQIKAKLTLTGTNTPVQFLIERAGPIKMQG